MLQIYMSPQVFCSYIMFLFFERNTRPLQIETKFLDQQILAPKVRPTKAPADVWWNSVFHTRCAQGTTHYALRTNAQWSGLVEFETLFWSGWLATLTSRDQATRGVWLSKTTTRCTRRPHAPFNAHDPIPWTVAARDEVLLSTDEVQTITWAL